MALNKVSKRKTDTEEGPARAADGTPLDVEREAEPEQAQEHRTAGKAETVGAPADPAADELAQPVREGAVPQTAARVVRVEDEATQKAARARIPAEQREYRVKAVTYYDGGQKPALPGAILSGLSEKQSKSLLDQGAIEEVLR